MDSSVSVGYFDSWFSEVIQRMYVETIGSRMEPQGETSNYKISKAKRWTEGDWGKVARKTGRGTQNGVMKANGSNFHRDNS